MAVMAAALLAPAPSWAGCKLEQVEIPVHMVGRRPVATVTLNGTEVRLLVDSGAFFSMLSPSTATQLQLPLRMLPHGMRIEGYTGRIDAKLTRVKTMGLVGAHLSDIEFLVGGNELGAGIMGVLGRNILSMADTEYDLAHGAVRLSFPKGECGKTSFAHWAGDAPVIQAPLEQDHDKDTAARLEVRINGQRTMALMDTGAAETSLTLRAARRAGMDESTLTPSGRTGGAGAGLVKSWTGLVASFELGGQKITHSRLQIDDTARLDEGMLLGLDYFLSHRIYVSRLQKQVYATWNGKPIFEPSRAGAIEYDARHVAVPQEIDNDNADALARRGAAAIAAGNHALALQDLNRACELAPDVAGYFFARARVHQAMGQAAAALADLDEALRLDAALAEARFRRATVRVALGDEPGAVSDLAHLDAALPASSAWRADMGELHARIGQAPQALRQLDLWVDTHPADMRLASVLNSRCWLRTTLNVELPLALQDCKRAVDLDDQAAAYRDSLGWAYLRLGEPALAKKAFDGAIQQEPLPLSLYGRGLAQLRLNDVAGAERDLAAARALKPSIDDDVRQRGLETADGSERPAPEGS